jgi:hypothetical protein
MENVLKYDRTRDKPQDLFSFFPFDKPLSSMFRPAFRAMISDPFAPPEYAGAVSLATRRSGAACRTSDACAPRAIFRRGAEGVQRANCRSDPRANVRSFGEGSRGVCPPVTGKGRSRAESCADFGRQLASNDAGNTDPTHAATSKPTRKTVIPPFRKDNAGVAGSVKNARGLLRLPCQLPSS